MLLKTEQLARWQQHETKSEENSSKVAEKIVDYWKALTRGRTDHLSDILVDRGNRSTRKLFASCYLFTASNSGLFFSYSRPSQQCLNLSSYGYLEL